MLGRVNKRVGSYVCKVGPKRAERACKRAQTRVPVYTLMQITTLYRSLIHMPYSNKRKQLLKMAFLVNEQKVSVMYIDINAISLYLD